MKNRNCTIFALGLLALAAADNPTGAQSTYEPYTFTTLAGNVTRGSTDGTESAARFKDPQGVAVDSVGNVYVADSGNHTIRKVTPDGVVTTLAGLAGSPGNADGTGNAARFGTEFRGGPSGVAVDSVGNVYVGDSPLNNTIRKITPGGVVTTLASMAALNPHSADGTGSAAGFWFPFGVAVDIADNVYVADTGNNTIRMGYPASTILNSGQPINQTASLFGDANFHVKATGTAPLSYQWRFNDADLVGMTNASLTITNVQRADAGNYTVVVTHLSSSVTSEVATLTITPFKSIYCFGFSWTDTQAISHDGTTRTTPYNNPLYWKNRASNGPMWPEFVSTNLGLAYLAANNYARGGSSLSDILNQVANFPVPPKPQLSVYCLWLGNTADIRSEPTWNQSIQSDILVNSNAVNRLYAKGARTIVIESQFDQDPSEQLYFGTNTVLRSRYHDYFARLNAGFIDAMNRYSQTKPDLRFVFVDVFSKLDEVLANPTHYNFTKTDIGAVDDTALTNQSFNGPGADYVFWDNLHPSTKLHELIAAWHLGGLTNSILEKLDATIVGRSPGIQMTHLQIGRDYTLQQSTELKIWTDVQRFTASAGTNQWSSAVGDSGAGYFRLKWEQ